MADFIKDTMDSLGYLGVGLLMLLENIVPPIPSEVVMPAAGAAAGSGQHSLIGMIIAGTIGTIIGALPWYYVARWVGTDRLTSWADRHGHWLGTDGDEIKRVDEWFDRYGYWVVVFGRLVPGIRTLISVPAGFSEMPLGRFLLATAIGTGIWTALLALLGYWLQGQQEFIANIVSWVGMGVVGLLLLLYIAKIVRHQAGKSAGEPA